MNNEQTKFCKHCGEKIPVDAIICTKCGRQVEELKKNENNSIIINNNNSASASASATATATVIPGIGITGRPKNKWIALALCATLCGHKFYEGKFGMGMLYLFTLGLWGVGCIIDAIDLLGKPNPYYV